MFHLAAFGGSIGNTANTDMPAIQDDILAISNSHFLPQHDMSLIAAYAIGAELLRARMVSPSNRQVTLPFIRPLDKLALPPTDPNLADYLRNPFRIRGLEEFAVEVSNSAAGPTRTDAFVWLAANLQPSPVGDIFTFRGTSTTAAVANTWTTVSTTFADILPAGRYAVVGLEYVATNAKAARVLFEDQLWRPGCLGMATVALRTAMQFYKGRLGVWGRFSSTRLPIIQVFNGSTDNSHEFYLDIVRVAG